MVVAGEDGSQQIFHVRKADLERSPVFKGWFEDPDSMPGSIRKNGAFYFPHCQPDVVFAIVKYLEGDQATFPGNDFANDAAILQAHNRDPLFYIRVYKLAGSLA